MILCRHIGHNCFECSSFIHDSRQCWGKISVLLLSLLFPTAKFQRVYTMWKECPQFPITRRDLLSKIHCLNFDETRAQTYKEDNHRREIYKSNRSHRIERDRFHRRRHQACPISMRQRRSIL